MRPATKEQRLAQERREESEEEEKIEDSSSGLICQWREKAAAPTVEELNQDGFK